MTAATIPVHLRRTDENSDEIAELTARFGTAVGLAGVLGQLDRQGRRDRAPGWAVDDSFTWDDGDRTTGQWWPQGITTSADACAPGEVDRRRLLITSWYSKADEGSRITVVDLDSLAYRHVLLVDPDHSALTEHRLRPLSVHAGGLVWCGPYLHIAGTLRGLITCRLDDIVEVTPGPASFGHRFVLPARFAYDGLADHGTTPLRYSFLSLDRRTEPPTLVAGEYAAEAGQTRRLVHYRLDPRTWHLSAGEDGLSRPTWLDDRGITHMQGAALVGQDYYLTRSRGPNRLATLYVGGPGSFHAYPRSLPYGAEDITYWPGTDRLWSLTEHPGRRWVFAMDRRQFGRPTLPRRAYWMLARGIRASWRDWATRRPRASHTSASSSK